MKIEKNNLADRFIILLLLLASSWIIFNNLGASTLADFDESRHAQNALEMLRTGDWAVLQYAGEPDLWNLKPPLGAWLIAVSFKLFGINEFAARFWSAFFGVGLVIVVYLFAKEVKDRTTGMIAAALLLANRGFLGFHAARSGDYDVPAAFFIALSFYLFSLYVRKRQRALLIGVGILTALTALTKGGLGISIPAVILIYVLVSGSLGRYLNKDSCYAALAFLAVVLPWSIARLLRGPDYFEKAIRRDLFERIVNHVDGVGGDLLHYFHHLKGAFGVFLFYLFLASLVYSVYIIVKKKSQPVILLAVWIALFLLVFSAARTKLFWYIIPIYPAASILTANMIVDLGQLFKARQMVILAVFFCLISYSLVSVIRSTNERWAARDVSAAKLLKDGLMQADELYVIARENRQSLFFYLSLYSGGRVKIIRSLAAIRGKKPGYFLLTFNKAMRRSLERRKDYRLVRSVDSGGVYGALFLRQ